MSFNQAGEIKIKIEDVVFAEPKFASGPNDFDICVKCVAIDDTAQADWWRGEVSENYGRGNFAAMTQREITMMTLRKIGFEGDDLTKLPEQVVGKETVAMIKATEKDDRIYHNISYIGGGGGDQPVKIDNATMQSRLAALTGGGATGATSGSSAPAPSNDDNPFA